MRPLAQRPRSTTSGVRRRRWRRFSSEPREVREPDLDERTDRVLQAGLAGRLERLLVALTGFGGVDALLEAVVPCDEELLNPLSCVVPLHKSTVTVQIEDGTRAMEAAVNMSDGIRVLIADDHRLFGQALEAILATDERLEVVGHAGDGSEAVQLALSVQPEVILMDISMPIMDGFQATKQIRKQLPQARVLMLTGSNSRIDVDRAREAGAAGYVTKDRIAAELIDAILEVVAR
jgi:CheY-like chemotaxis protein